MVSKKRIKEHVLKRMVDAPVLGKGRGGRQKIRWKDSCKRDMESLGSEVEDVLDRTKWKGDIFITIPANPDDGKIPRKKMK